MVKSVQMFCLKFKINNLQIFNKKLYNYETVLFDHQLVHGLGRAIKKQASDLYDVELLGGSGYSDPSPVTNSPLVSYI